MSEQQRMSEYPLTIRLTNRRPMKLNPAEWELIAHFESGRGRHDVYVGVLTRPVDKCAIVFGFKWESTAYAGYVVHGIPADDPLYWDWSNVIDCITGVCDELRCGRLAPVLISSLPAELNEIDRRFGSSESPAQKPVSNGE